MIKYLLSKASTGKFRVVYLSTTEQWDEEKAGFVINRVTGQLHGKMTEQPEIVITKGKAGRTHREQLELQFKSELKKYLDKGYKELENDPETYSETQLEEFYGDIKTDQNGFAKHMLAKSADKVKESSINKVKYWYASRKIDGVRCSFYYKDGEILSASRGGGNYDYSTSHIRNNERLLEFFRIHPTYILDGELYRHGKSLQQISGAARLEKNAVDCDWLEYYVYDIMIPSMKFSDRLEILKQLQKELNLGFNPDKDWEEGELQLQIVPQEKVSGYENIMKLHNQYVSEGWEGVVCRNPDKEYGFGKRTNDMLKFKFYKDAEFEITGLSEGLREEDMCFTLITEDGIEFKAKPMGSRELKQQYRERLKELIGKMATVKYFYLSDEGTPLQPVLKCIRDYE